MDIRCATCSKLFRIADEKISGKGIRFKCSQCGEIITVLKEEAERERQAREALAPSAQEVHHPPFIPSAPPAAPAPPPDAPVPESSLRLETEEQTVRDHQPPAPSSLDEFDFSEPHAAAASAGSLEQAEGGDIFANLRPETEKGGEEGITISEEEERSAEESVAFPADIISEPKHKAVFDVSPEKDAGAPFRDAIAPSAPEAEQMTLRRDELLAAAAPSFAASQTLSGTEYPEEEKAIDLGAALAIPRTPAISEPEPFEEASPELPEQITGGRPRRPGWTVLTISIVMITLASSFAALYHLGFLPGMRKDASPLKPQQKEGGAGREISAHGLVIEDPLAYLDPVRGDLMISGRVRNTLDRPIPGWYLVVEVTDGSQKVVATVRMMNGVQVFTKRDLDILAGRGKDAARLRDAVVRSVGTAAVPANGAANFEAVLPEPPAGVAGFLPSLKTFDPEFVIRGMMREMSEGGAPGR